MFLIPEPSSSPDSLRPAPQGRRPILITGSPRSGTTWIGDVLRAAPRTMVLMEPFNPELSRLPARHCNFHFREWYTYVTGENAAEFTPPLRRMLELRHDTWIHLRASNGVKDIIDVAAAAARFRLSRLLGATPIMKDPVALLSSQWIAREFGARVVVLIRHPAAVVSSFLRLGLPVDIPGLLRQPLLMRDLLYPMEGEFRDLLAAPRSPVEYAAMLWKALYFAVHCFQQQHSNWLFIRHEDLSQDPVAGFEKICHHVGIEFTPRIRRAVLDSNDAALPPELDPKLAFTTRRNVAANLTNWKTRVSQDDLRIIRQRVEQVSQHFYQDSEWESPA
jgi:Sulfotransferase family